ncbi:hypothetical protein [Swingsia samuiensis]|uniref:Uncharacterized protein n=1 Tax=Swingsia samuiensis TaxID=1293412 RepID=A0A4Y6UFC7_9PROT|nr:hypothetical protein [Swingsia samuiensis]QDH16253.1 hypothetical protein E3D00_00690 [Swingsia samuiensis]
MLVDSLGPQNKRTLARTLYIEHRLPNLGIPQEAIWIRTTGNTTIPEYMGIINVTFPLEGTSCSADQRRVEAEWIVKYCKDLNKEECKEWVEDLGNE